MKNQAMNVVTEFLTAVQKGNFEKLGTLLHPNVRWSQPGDNLVSGLKNSAGEVFQMVGQMMELSVNTLTLTEIKLLAENENQIACVLNWSVQQANGDFLEMINIDVYTVEEGCITNVVVFSENLDLENEYWKN
ncbi:nuclear transport factor 2 family protein [Pedobacter sp. Hv1]|uniref:nuclear transport factor 2 family protein n=1 Tax=Pedobacter sp. Hv1 TaxID=1740090 RepID=UPI0006D8C64A|nr:nuclear transport factor 2 family protein [Pedobacter sp. Hv1]KQC01187.1 hypothetical protein AQF98_11030 [Pedobacter sp. Hv1]